MADGYISAVQLPGNNTYDIKDKNAVTEIQINGTAQTKTNGVVNLPAYPSDTKVIQGDTTTSRVRPLILEYNSYTLTEGADDNIETNYISSNVTNQVYRTNNIYASPANGRLYLSSTTTPQMYLKYRTLDYTLADNGMSSEQWVGYRIVDKNNKVVALFNLDVFPDGKIGAFVRAGNYNSATSSGVSGYMGVFVYKDGSVSYSISHKDKFREAIEVYSKLETETPIRSYLTSTVGHACKNLFDMDKINQSQSGISNISMTQSTGSLSFTGTGVYKSISITDTELGVQRYGKTYTVSCINNLVSTTSGRITIRKQSTNVVVKSAWFDTTGTKSITFTPDEATFPDGWYISILATGSASETGSVDISQLMLRESTILDDTFEPYQEPTDLRAIKVKQSLNAQKKFYPLLFSSAEYSNSTSDIIDTVGRTNNTFIYPYSGWVYAGGGFCAGATTSSTEGKRCYINVHGITANNYKADYSIAAYERQIIQAYAGKCSDSTGLLLRIDSGGLTIIGGGESGQNLAGLIDDDQTAESPARLDIDNSQGDTTKETTALLGNSEHLILASDGNIYFVTKCNSINAPNRVGVCLSNERVFYPMRDNTGKIGTSNYRWQYGYFGQVYGTGGSGKWRVARDNASFINSTPPNANVYAPAIDLKTTSGDWSIGSLGSEENLYFAYVADSIYSGTANTARKYRLCTPSTPDSNTYDILHTGNLQTYTIPNVTSVGTLPSLVTKNTSFYPVKSTTTTASKIVSKDTTIYPVTSSTTTASKVVTKDTTFYPVTSSTTTASKVVVKNTTIYPVTSSTTTATKVTLGTSISADDITSWDVGTLPSFTVSKGVLTLDSGSLPSLSYTARSIPNVTGNTDVTVPILSSSVTVKGISTISDVTVPILSSSVTVKGISTNTDVTVPILSSSITIKEINTNTDVTVPILSSSVTISGVSTWSAGTLPSLGTAISVVGLSST